MDIFQTPRSQEKEVIFLTVETIHYTAGTLHFSRLHLDSLGKITY
jgi:hypothetical protein